LSYANVISTVALFVALGGASYAAIALPAGSVGTRQLRTAAVTPRVLGFPLDVRTFTDPKPRDLVKRQCGQTPGPQGPFYGFCQLRLIEGDPLGRVQLDVGGSLAVTGVASLEDQGPPGTTAQVQLALFADRRPIDRAIEVLKGCETVRVPLQGVGRGRAGTNSVGFSAAAHYDYDGRGDVVVRAVSLVVTALPSS
jgi:hypothetical protein